MQLRSLLLCLLLPATCVVHAAERTLATIQGFSQQFIVSLPTGWEIGYHYNDGFNAITKLIPIGASPLSAQQIITIEAYRDVAARTQYDSTVMLRSIYQKISLRCSQEVINIPVRNPGFLGYDSAMAVLGCPGQLDQARQDTDIAGQMSVYLAIKGHRDMYVITTSVRNSGFTAGNPPINASNYRAYLAMIAPIWLCNTGTDIPTCQRSNQQARHW